MDPDQEVVGKLSFTRRPSWRVVRAELNQLERELRKRDSDHELMAVTQSGETYTLFFRLRPAQAAGSERVLRD